MSINYRFFHSFQCHNQGSNLYKIPYLC